MPTFHAALSGTERYKRAGVGGRRASLGTGLTGEIAKALEREPLYSRHALKSVVLAIAWLKAGEQTAR